jgi:predicted component of type VI protein secretion system
MVSDGGAGTETAQWALRFISGKYQGGEFPLRPHREIIIGRSSDLDMVLVEDMVSRKHAKITTDEQTVTIQDLGSTNGTFVNGEKVRKADLKDGDRILIGTSIIKIVYVDGEATSALSENEARNKLAVAANKKASAPKSMAGSIEEIPLPDLLQLLSTSRKSGVLVVRSDAHVGKLFFRKGQIYFANLEGQASIGPRKAFVRMLGWAQGTFELEPPDETPVAQEMEESTEALLMEGMRQLAHDGHQRAPAAEASPAGAHPGGAGRISGCRRGEDRRRGVRPLPADRPGRLREAGRLDRKRLSQRELSCPRSKGQRALRGTVWRLPRRR